MICTLDLADGRGHRRCGRPRTLGAAERLRPRVTAWAPRSPPRFALPGVVDIVADHDIVAGHASRDVGNGQNHYSAMPSLHGAR
jgi:hypothetical protein